MKLEAIGDGYRLVDETGAAIEIEDEDELMDAFLALEKHFGRTDPEVRYQELTTQLAKLTQAIIGNWGIADIFALACKRLNTKETSDLITLLQGQKAKAEAAHGSYTDMLLGDLEDHPF